MMAQCRMEDGISCQSNRDHLSILAQEARRRAGVLGRKRRLEIK
jgi:hypothetical protein